VNGNLIDTVVNDHEELALNNKDLDYVLLTKPIRLIEGYNEFKFGFYICRMGEFLKELTRKRKREVEIYLSSEKGRDMNLPAFRKCF